MFHAPLIEAVVPPPRSSVTRLQPLGESAPPVKLEVPQSGLNGPGISVASSPGARTVAGRLRRTRGAPALFRLGGPKGRPGSAPFRELACAVLPLRAHGKCGPQAVREGPFSRLLEN